MQSNDYLKAVTLILDTIPFGLAGGAIYDCGDDTDLIMCGALTPGNKPTDGKNYAADIVVSNNHKDDYPAENMPSGYELYYNKGTSDSPDWIKCADSTLASFLVKKEDDCSPFKDGARKYDPDGSKVFGFAIVPFFEKGGVCSDDAFTTKTACEAMGETWTPVRISQTDMNASKGVFVNEDNFQKMINEFGK
jgi:hypothetical protein